MRIYQHLKEQQVACSRSYVSRIVQELSLKTVHRKPYTVTTTWIML